MEITNNSQMAIKLCIERIVNLAEKGISENKEALIKDSIELTEVLKTYSDEYLKAEVDKKVAESIKDLPTKDFLEAKIAQSEASMIRWMAGIAIGTVSANAGIILLLLKIFLPSS